MLPISQEVKFSQLKEYSMKSILFKNHPPNVVQKLVTDPFIKHQN